MINLESIKNPKYNQEKTMLRFEYISARGTEEYAFIAVTEGASANKTYNYIIENFGKDYLEEQHKKDIEALNIARQKKKKQENETEQQHKEKQRISKLFDLKVEVLKMPWIDSTDNELVLAIRSASSAVLVSAISNMMFQKYMEQTNKLLEDVVNEVEEIVYSEE